MKYILAENMGHALDLAESGCTFGSMQEMIEAININHNELSGLSIYQVYQGCLGKFVIRKKTDRKKNR
jgi:hypothetical protein